MAQPAGLRAFPWLTDRKCVAVTVESWYGTQYDIVEAMILTHTGFTYLIRNKYIVCLRIGYLGLFSPLPFVHVLHIPEYMHEKLKVNC